MSEENVEVVRRIYDAIERRETATVLPLYDPDVVWDFTRSPFRNFLRHNVYHGRQALREFMGERYADAWETASDELLELIDAGEHVVSVVKSKGRGRVSGAEAEKVHAGVWTVRGGVIVRVEWMGSREEALEAAGLSE